MNRQQRRAQERAERREYNKRTVMVTNQEIKEWKEDLSNDVSTFAVDTLMTSFALTLYEIYGFEWEDIQKCLERVDQYMGMVLHDETTVPELKQRLEDEAGIRIKS